MRDEYVLRWVNGLAMKIACKLVNTCCSKARCLAIRFHRHEQLQPRRGGDYLDIPALQKIMHKHSASNIVSHSEITI